MYTDPARVRADIPGNVKDNPVFIYHDIFNPDKEEVADLKDRYGKGSVGDVEVKEKLAKALNKHLSPIREKRASLSEDDMLRVLKDGAVKASKTARGVMSKVKECLHQVF